MGHGKIFALHFPWVKKQITLGLKLRPPFACRGQDIHPGPMSFRESRNAV
jgi:hypothetical protein